MRVKTWVKIEDEIEIDVDPTELINGLPGCYPEPEESLLSVQSMISRCYACLKAVPDEVIAQMTPKAREVVLNGLREQAARYETPALRFQDQVREWIEACFGELVADDKTERNHRFLEEALELVQACGCSQEDAYQLVDYVYGRPTGDLEQEVGGALLTLASLCSAQGMDMDIAGDKELERAWKKIEEIRKKQAAKPPMSPLPQ